MKNNRVVLVSVAMIFIAAFIAVLIVSCKNGATESAPATQQENKQQKKADISSAFSTVSDPMLTMGVEEVCVFPQQDGASYSCDRTDVLTVDAESGLMTAKKEGYAIVTAKSGSSTAKTYVTVKKAPSKLKFPVSALNMQKGEKASLTAIPEADDEGFSKAVLTSGDGDIVSVSDSGEITAVKEGTATIKAEVYNGQSAEIEVTVLDNSGFTDKTTIAATTLRKEAGWNYPSIADVPEGSKVQQYGESDDGRWLHVKSGNNYGWMYNKAFEDTKNYSEYTLETLPVMADDLIFDIGTDKRDIFDFVYNIDYGVNKDDTTENLCVDYFRTVKGSCYTHGAMLCYLYNRCGYETVRVVGISALDHSSEHSWCLSKTENGWKHVDAQYFSIREADDQFFIDDYSKFFNWDKDKNPAMEVSASN